MPDKKTVIALAGGGARGIWQAGAIAAIVDAGIKPHTIIGTSAGSLNGAAWLSSGLEVMKALWLHVQNKHVYTWAPWKLFTSDASCFSSEPLATLIYEHVDFRTLLAQPIPFLVNVTYVGSYWEAERYNLSAHSRISITCAHSALMASSAAPIGLPPVRTGTGFMVDGGVTDNFGISDAINAGAERVIMVTPTIMQTPKVRNVIDMLWLLNAVSEGCAFENELRYAHDKGVELVIIQPDKPLPIGLLDFTGLGNDTRRRGFLDAGYDTARKILGALK